MRLSRRRAFVLLEVMVSLAILGVALSMVLRSFTVSLRAARLSENATAAGSAARILIEQWELQPPPVGESQGEIPMDERLFYKVRYAPQEPSFEIAPAFEEARYAWFRPLTLEIFIRRGGTERRVLILESALTGAERFTPEARKENDIGFDL